MGNGLVYQDNYFGYSNHLCILFSHIPRRINEAVHFPAKLGSSIFDDCWLDEGIDPWWTQIICLRGTGPNR